jgi:hypothetical protein
MLSVFSCIIVNIIKRKRYHKWCNQSKFINTNFTGAITDQTEKRISS